MKSISIPGWTAMDTGGGCTALVTAMTDANGKPCDYFMATDDACIPQWGDEITIGWYDAEGYPKQEKLWTLHYSDHADFLMDGNERDGYGIEPDDTESDFFIHDAFLSECMRGPVNPIDHYGIPGEIAAFLAALNNASNHPTGR